MANSTKKKLGDSSKKWHIPRNRLNQFFSRLSGILLFILILGFIPKSKIFDFTHKEKDE